MEWVNRIGMLLEFVSFWLIAPELLGEARLRRMETLVQFILRLVDYIVFSLVFIFLSVSGLWLFRSLENSVIGSHAELTKMLILPTIILGLIPFPITYFINHNFRTEKRRRLISWTLQLSYALLGAYSLYVLCKLPPDYSDRLWFIGWVGVTITNWISMLFSWAIKKILAVMADDSRIRARALTVGIGLFVIAFMLQFIATFIN